MITGCSHSGEVKSDYSGGIAGMLNSNETRCSQSISGCTVTGSTVSGLHNAGGLVGKGCIGVTFFDSSVSDSTITATSEPMDTPEV